MADKNRFAMLNQINVNDHTEKKNGLTYLSWAWAWSQFKSVFPESFYTIYESKEECNYFTDGLTAWVKTGVTLVDGDYSLELIEYLPVMDFKNKSIPVKQITSFDVNKAIQRSLTKAVARHGLGLYIYAGEDLPEETEEAKQARAAEEQERKSFICIIDEAVKELTANLTPEQKMTFANKYIVPALGIPNYKLATNNEQLGKLAAELTDLKKAQEEKKSKASTKKEKVA